MDNLEFKDLISGVWLNNIHRFRTRIYYDATDAGGIVYHADYLTLAEHARTESLRSCEVNQIDILGEQGVSLAVRYCSVDFKKPARLDDLIEIQTEFNSVSGAKIEAKQTIHKITDGVVDENWLVQLNVQLACINSRGRATRFPRLVRQAISTMNFDHKGR
jgi:acyl-CoA thioester hydrolase